MWFPWDNDGPDGERKTVSLMVKYIPKNGSSPFLSGQAKCVLPGKEPVFIANRSYEGGPISQVNYEFGRNDRSNEQIPPGFRDWTKQDTSPEERQIRTTNNRPTRMVKTTIPISGSAYSAIMQNNSPANPVESTVAQSEWNQHAPLVLQNVSESNPRTPDIPKEQSFGGRAPVPPKNFDPQYAPTETTPTPTDFTPASFLSPTRTEQQGNTTVTYFNVGETGVSSTNPLSRGGKL